MPHVRSAVSSAVDLMNLPSRVRGARSEPLPGDVALLLRLAAGDSDAEQQAAAITERPPEVNRRAAAFFIEQILLSPDADSYRILGGTSTTSSEDLRRNMALLVRWLHPDIEASGERSIFARRVTAAWEDVKTPERRAAYDATQLATQAHKASLKPERGSKPRRRQGNDGARMAAIMAPPGVRGLWHRFVIFLSGGRWPG